MEAAEEEAAFLRSFWHHTRMPVRQPLMIHWLEVKVRNQDLFRGNDDPEEDCNCGAAVESICSTDEDHHSAAAAVVTVPPVAGSADVDGNDDDVHCRYSRARAWPYLPQHPLGHSLSFHH